VANEELDAIYPGSISPSSRSWQDVASVYPSSPLPRQSPRRGQSRKPTPPPTTWFPARWGASWPTWTRGGSPHRRSCGGTCPGCGETMGLAGPQIKPLRAVVRLRL